jgi:hypothetical protein
MTLINRKIRRIRKAYRTYLYARSLGWSRRAAWLKAVGRI